MTMKDLGFTALRVLQSRMLLKPDANSMLVQMFNHNACLLLERLLEKLHNLGTL